MRHDARVASLLQRLDGGGVNAFEQNGFKFAFGGG